MIKTKETVFREYDIRGKVGQELYIEEAYSLAQAIVYFFKQKNSALSSIVVGMDGRTHSPKIKKYIIDAVIDSGINVIDIGLCPTPVLYFSLYTLAVDAGIMITASHNPKEYNGLKLCLYKSSVWGLEVKEIRKLFYQKKHIVTQLKGTYTKKEIISLYLDWHIERFKDLSGISIPMVIDCGNGATGAVIPQLIKKMKWQNVQLLYEKVDGEYPNHDANPTCIENMQDVKKLVISQDDAVGIGFDGDGDRVGVMTEKGQLLAGDRVLSIFAFELLQKHPKAGVVFDVKSSQGVIDFLQQQQATLHMAPTGHAIIKDTMKQHEALLGGELSCHFFFKDEHFGYDDGVYAFLRLLRIVKNSKKTVCELSRMAPKKINTIEYSLCCPDEKKKAVIAKIKESFVLENKAKLLCIDGIRATYENGWGIIRASNTKPAITLRFEASTVKGLKEIKQTFIDKMVPYFGKSDLEKKLNK